ncbi:DUF4129 domain-containing protein [Haloarchaeobius litoreus]|uniref:DUF4129 domain-containing protein n=1 Tax=Haloarchaeobius litoreus TaxID=755306 RepID=A0ABD6DN70_9EURY|nr:DUF4129 domain-containing protein [Haloarchaeobius litoreus]
MERGNVLSVGLAICLLFALGASSNALGDAVTTEPDEVIDVDYSSLPFSEDDAGELRDAVTGEDEGGPSTEPGTSGQRVVPEDEGESESVEPERSGPGGGQQLDDGEGDERREIPRDMGGEPQDEAGANPDVDGDQEAPGDEQGQGSTPTEPERSLLDRLLALLGQLLPFVLLLGALALLYVFRHRLTGLFDGRDAERATQSQSVTYVADPEDEVSAAWYEMVRTLGLDQDVSKTPRECEEAARAAGADPSLARTLTDLYEQVRYAGQPVTEERSRRARETVEEFKRQYGGVT